MKPFRFRWGSRLSLLGLLALALALTPPASSVAAQQFRPAGPHQPVFVQGHGTDLFRAVFDAADIVPVSAHELRDLGADADLSDLIVVVIGNPGQWQPNDPTRWARHAIQKGGAALIASDYDVTLYPAGDPFNSVGSFKGELVRANVKDSHDGLVDCPFAVPVSPEELTSAPDPNGRVWSVFRGLSRVATNKPTHIELNALKGEYRYPLARLPRSSYSWGGRFRTPPLFAVGHDGPAGGNGPGHSFLAVADSSVYINQMLMAPDTDNRQFAFRTVEYLRGPNGERKRCLFFEDGRVVDRFDGLRSALAPQQPPVPPGAVPNIGPLFGKHQDKLITLLDAKADELQQRDALHRSLVGPEGSEREQRSAARWVERLLVLASVAIVFFLLRKLWAVRHPQDSPPPPNAGAGAASTGPPGVFDRRQKELVRRNNVYEPVRALVCEFFARAGAPAAPGPRMPALEITDAVRKPDSLRQAVRDLWRLAYGPPTTLTAQRWYELEPYFERLKQAHADGKWRFVL